MLPTLNPDLRLVFWESTAGCNLRCVHCRRLDVMDTLSRDDLSTAAARDLIDQIAETAKPILVFSGGEPLMRPDIFELAAHARARGLRPALATNGTKIDAQMAWRIKEAGFARVAISLDGADPETHDLFRGIPGSHDKSVRALAALRSLGVGTQINFTVTNRNVGEVPEIYEQAIALGVDALHFFMFVPVGCGVAIAEKELLSAREAERWLEWLYDRELEGRIELKATCSPHYFRVVRQDGRTPPASHRRQQHAGRPPAAEPASAGHAVMANPAPPAAGRGAAQALHQVTRGCLAGVGVAFVSHKGDVFPCGYLPLPCGNVRERRFKEIWEDSPVFASLRDPNLLEGKCGACNFKGVCGGCRARGYARSGGDWLAEEPLCEYQPQGRLVAAGMSRSD